MESQEVSEEFYCVLCQEKEYKSAGTGADSSSGIASASSPDETVSGVVVDDNCRRRWRNETNDVVRQYVDSQLAVLSTINSLPEHLLTKIFSNLNAVDLSRCAAVCRHWFSICWESNLWRNIRLMNNNNNNSNLPVNNRINVDKALKSITKRLSYDTPTVCIGIESIDLSGSNLTDFGLKIIGRRCPELRTLIIRSNTNVTNVGVCEVVSRCVNLNRLDVSACPAVTCLCLSPTASAHLPAHAKQVFIRHLDLSECFNLEDTGLHLIASYCTRLQFVYLRKCEKLTDIGLQYLCSLCNTIKELSVSDCPLIGDDGIILLAERLQSNLRYLSVAKCHRLTDLGLFHLAKYCKRLRYFNVRSCSITDRGIGAISRSLSSRLKSLDVGKTSISDQGVLYLYENCTQLRKLSLKSCRNITDQSIINLSKACVYLQHLNIHDCDLLTNRSYRAVKRYCKRCVIEHSNPIFF